MEAWRQAENAAAFRVTGEAGPRRDVIMGIGFVLAFWGILSGVTLAFVTGCVFLVLRKGVKKSLVAGVTMFLVGLIGGPILFLLEGEYVLWKRSHPPARLFQYEFGFQPPGDVTDLSGELDGLADWGTVVLRFKANEETVQKILKLNFVEVEKEKLRMEDKAVSAPFFAERLGRKSIHYYESDHFDERFGSSSAYLFYDTETRDVYFNWIGID